MSTFRNSAKFVWVLVVVSTFSSALAAAININSSYWARLVLGTCLRQAAQAQPYPLGWCSEAFEPWVRTLLFLSLLTYWLALLIYSARHMLERRFGKALASGLAATAVGAMVSVSSFRGSSTQTTGAVPEMALLFNTPIEIEEGKTAEVLAIYRAKHFPRHAPAFLAPGRNETQISDLRPYPRLYAVLSGIGFAIDPTGVQLREFQKGKSTTWSWMIRAEPIPGRRTLLSPGREDRFLSLVVEGQAANSNKTRAITTVTRAVRVLSSVEAFWDRFMESLKDGAWIIGSAITPVILALAWLLNRSKWHLQQRQFEES